MDRSAFSSVLDRQNGSSGYFRRTAAKASRSVFGVTGGDGKPYRGAGSGGGDTDDHDKEHGRGVQFADAAIAGSVLTTRHPYDLSITQADPRVATVLLATRAPQTLGVNLCGSTLEALPFVPTPLPDGSGGYWPVYEETQAVYSALVAALWCPWQPPVDVAAPSGVFTDRGRPPDVFDDTMLWPLPVVDPPGAPPFCVATNEDGVFDMVAWRVWRTLRDALAPYCTWGPEAADIRTLVVTTRTHLEDVGTKTLDGYVRAAHLAMLSARGMVQRVFLRTYAARVGAGAACVPHLGAEVGIGARRLLEAAATAPTATHADLLRAGLWVSAAADFLTAPTLPDALPVPRTLSDNAPITLTAYAALVAAWAVAVWGLNPDTADIIRRCMTMGQTLNAQDAEVVVRFGRAPYASAGSRLGWIAQWV
jgi:hypothetical protein